MRLPKVLAIVVLIFGVACMPRGPVLGTGSRPTGVGGTISGIVRTSGGSAVSGRRVTAIEVTSGARYEASSGINGGYTIKVPTGKYRLEVELRAGETLSEQPAETEITTSDVDASRDFVITVKERSHRDHHS